MLEYGQRREWMGPRRKARETKWLELYGLTLLPCGAHAPHSPAMHWGSKELLPTVWTRQWRRAHHAEVVPRGHVGRLPVVPHVHLDQALVWEPRKQHSPPPKGKGTYVWACLHAGMPVRRGLRD